MLAEVPQGGRVTDWLFRSRDQMLLVLISLMSEPKHGHAIMLDVRSFAGITLQPGTLYGAIARLEEEGLIEALQPDGRRRPYRLTARGSTVVRARLEELSRAVDTGLTRQSGGAG
jgi:DNA-binding PadR family transcriptional regulator